MNPGPLQLAVHGTGRMAQAITEAASNRPGLNIKALVGPREPSWPSKIPWYETLEQLDSKPDLLIDFTLPEGTRLAADWCSSEGVPLVSGVTGLEAGHLDSLRQAAQSVPVLWSPNLSLGVNLLARLAADAARVVPAGTPVHIEETHHQWKKDAPSGTALMLGGVVEQRMGEEQGYVSYESFREGEVVGDHTVTFTLAGESFDLVHRAGDRSIFARGALDAGAWLLEQPPGLYSASDWLSGLLQA